jgi:hypothetical protein
MVSEPTFLWPPIKRHSRSFFGIPSGGRPTLADRAANAVFPLFLRRSFRRPPIYGRPRRQFLRQLLLEPIAPPPIPLLAKITTKSGVSAPDRWICAISAHSGIAQTLRVQIRRDHRRPSFHAPTRASRRICQFCKRASRATTRRHGVARSSTRQLHLPRASTRPSTFWCVKFALPRALDLLAREFHASTRLLAREMHALHAAIRLLRVHYTRQAFFNPTRLLAREMHAPLQPAHFGACTTRARRSSSLSSFHVSSREPPRQP